MELSQLDSTSNLFRQSLRQFHMMKIEPTYPEVLILQVRFLSDHPPFSHVSITRKLHDFKHCRTNVHMN